MTFRLQDAIETETVSNIYNAILKFGKTYVIHYHMK